MIILRNYPKINTKIVIKNETYSIENYEDINTPIQGIGGVIDDGQLIGVYVEKDSLYFLHNAEVNKINPSELNCTNNYISKSKRCFSVIISDKNICNIVYEPYIDPGMIYYDSDPEEFDVLLYLSEILKNEETIHGFIKGVRSVKE